jgi:hypothetical protein
MTTRKLSPKKPGKWKRQPRTASAFFIEEFCRQYRLSPSMFWKLQAAGQGPRVMHVGRRRMISAAAAAEWARAQERTA